METSSNIRSIQGGMSLTSEQIKIQQLEERLKEVNNKVKVYEELIPYNTLEKLQSVEMDLDKANLEVARLNGVVQTLKESYDKAVLDGIKVKEKECSVMVRQYKNEAEALKKENSGLRSGIAGPEGKVRKANEDREIAINKLFSAQDLNKTLRDNLDRVTEALSNTKLMLEKQEANSRILEENNKHLLKQIEMLEEQKHMLEKLLTGQGGLSDKIDNIRATSNEAVNTDWYIVDVFKTYKDCSKVVKAILSELRLDGTKTKTQIAIDCGYASLQSYNSAMKKYKANGLFELLNNYNSDNSILDTLKNSDVYKELCVDKLIPIIRDIDK